MRLKRCIFTMIENSQFTLVSGIDESVPYSQYIVHEYDRDHQLDRSLDDCMYQ